MHHNVLSNTNVFQNLDPQKGWGRLIPCAGPEAQGPHRSRTLWGASGTSEWGHPQRKQMADHLNKPKRPGLASHPTALWGLDAPFSISRCLHLLRGEMPKMLLSKHILTVRLWAARGRGSRSLSVIYNKYQHLFSLVHHHHPWGETNWPGQGVPTSRHPPRAYLLTAP